MDYSNESSVFRNRKVLYDMPFKGSTFQKQFLRLKAKTKDPSVGWYVHEIVLETSI